MSKKLLVFAGVLFIAISAWSQDGKFSLFIKNFQTVESPQMRDIYVYLPPNYNFNKMARYPVLYVHDGQNLFDPERAFMGQTWNAENTLNTLIRTRAIRPLIVVAIDNTPSRTAEYTHDIDPNIGIGGKSDLYLQTIITDLIPQVNKSYRTLTNRQSTSIMGSSLGGLVSLYAGIQYSDTFGSVAALSPSIWWNKKSITSLYNTANQLPLKIYIDSGTTGGERPQDVTQFKNQLLKQYSDSNSVKSIIQTGASHNEYYWAQRLPEALKFLFNWPNR